jgi:Mrp family chromosome partitioning ATPase
VSSRVCGRTRWTSGTGVVGRLQKASRHVTGTLPGWLDSASRESVEDDLSLQADRDGQGVRVRVDLAGLTRQEQIKLVQRVFLAPAFKAKRAVLFAGVQRDNGCARICIRAGRTLARLTSQSVCVVDANLRSPVLHQLVGADNHDGLAAAVGHPGSGSTFARRLAPDNLWLLPSGSLASDPDLLLTADRVRPCVHELGALFDHILINAPPINLYAESLTLSQFVDGVVLVLEANVTRREIVRNMKAHLEDLNVPLLGIVLNNRTFPIPEAVYRLL